MATEESLPGFSEGSKTARVANKAEATSNAEAAVSTVESQPSHTPEHEAGPQVKESEDRNAIARQPHIVVNEFGDAQVHLVLPEGGPVNAVTAAAVPADVDVDNVDGAQVHPVLPKGAACPRASDVASHATAEPVVVDVDCVQAKAPPPQTSLDIVVFEQVASEISDDLTTDSAGLVAVEVGHASPVKLPRLNDQSQCVPCHDPDELFDDVFAGINDFIVCGLCCEEAFGDDTTCKTVSCGGSSRSGDAAPHALAVTVYRADRTTETLLDDIERGYARTEICDAHGIGDGPVAHTNS